MSLNCNSWLKLRRLVGRLVLPLAQTVVDFWRYAVLHAAVDRLVTWTMETSYACRSHRQSWQVGWYTSFLRQARPAPKSHFCHSGGMPSGWRVVKVGNRVGCDVLAGETISVSACGSYGLHISDCASHGWTKRALSSLACRLGSICSR